MKEYNKNCQIKIFENINELLTDEIELINIAKTSINQPYAPYSKFHVVAVAKLNDGSIIQGVNIENNSYGATICAERTLIANLMLNHANKTLDTLVLTYQNMNTNISDSPITPCGICRQSLAELITMQKKDIKLITTGINGNIWVFEQLSQLLPFAFDKL